MNDRPLGPWRSLLVPAHRRRNRRVERELEGALRQIANETPAYLWVTGADRKNSFINKPLADFMGTDTLTSEQFSAKLHPDDRERIIGMFEKCYAARRDFSDEYRLRGPDGQYRWFVANARALFTPVGEFVGYCGSLLDITDRKIAEQQAERTAAFVRAQNRILDLLGGNTPLPEVLDAWARSIEEISPEMLVSILLLDEDRLHVRHGAGPSLPEAYNRAIDGEAIGPQAGSCGTAAYRGERVIVEDIATDPLWERYRDVALPHGLHACWSTPIFEDGEVGGRHVLGTFAVYFRSPRAPTPEQTTLIDLATQTAALAIIRTRRAEDRRKSEERLRLAITGGNLAVWEWQIETDKLIWSEGLRTLFSGSEDCNHLTLGTLLDAIHPDDRARVESALRGGARNHRDYFAEYRIRLGDGSVRWLASHGRAEYRPDGTPLRMLGVARDITAQKDAEEEIRRREHQLNEAQRIAHVGSYEWDIASGKVYRSAELCRIFGVKDHQFEPTFEAYLARIHPEDRSSTRRIIEESLREGKPFDHEERILLPDGSVRILRSKGQYVFDDEGVPKTLIGICQDITDRKRVEEELQALSARLISAQEDERTRLARELHDDMAQQIAALTIAISNVRRAIPPALSDARAQSERVQDKLVQLADTTRRLSRELHPAVLQHAGLEAALREFCSEYSALTSIRVGFEATGFFRDLPSEIALCAYRVAQEALQNVAKHARADEVDVALTNRGDAVILRISDNGIGMDPNGGTTGLGLTSIRERARLVNGALSIQSGPERGTSLTLSLPIPSRASLVSAAG